MFLPALFMVSEYIQPKDAAINDAAIVGMRMAGQGHDELSVCIGMLPPLKMVAAWNDHNKRISKT